MINFNLKIASVFLIVVLFFTSCSKDSNARLANEQGKSGSITRFAIVDHYLYSLSNNEIVVFDITKKDDPTKINSIKVAYNIETIFSYIGRITSGWLRPSCCKK